MSMKSMESMECSVQMVIKQNGNYTITKTSQGLVLT